MVIVEVGVVEVGTILRMETVNSSCGRRVALFAVEFRSKCERRTLFYGKYDAWAAMVMFGWEKGREND